MCDIEKELFHYKDQFRDKVIYCNCDDPYESNFFKYFALNFNFFGIKKLITTNYVKHVHTNSYKIEITKVPDITGDGAVNLSDVEYLLKHDKNTSSPLEGNGAFQSQECIELLKQADIVVTNPPFSLFREYVVKLTEHEKKFLIIGNINAVTYREVFPLIKDNKVWLGYCNNRKQFEVPEPSDNSTSGKQLKTVGAVWYTNLDTKKCYQKMDFYRKYSPELYPKYDNYDAIEVSKVCDIPADYDGVMGVPITFLNKYNPEQFEIVGSFNNGKAGEEIGACTVQIVSSGKTCSHNGPVINGKAVYRRIVIRHRRVKPAGGTE